MNFLKLACIFVCSFVVSYCIGYYFTHSASASVSAPMFKVGDCIAVKVSADHFCERWETCSEHNIAAYRIEEVGVKSYRTSLVLSYKDGTAEYRGSYSDNIASTDSIYEKVSCP